MSPIPPNISMTAAERVASYRRAGLLTPGDPSRAPLRADPHAIAQPGRIPRVQLVAWLNAAYPRQVSVPNTRPGGLGS
jgi:hypothetical protein